ncbi:MAG: hypothetical protein ACOC0P_05210, partial [Planctomycetota bacterium]
ERGLSDVHADRLNPSLEEWKTHVITSFHRSSIGRDQQTGLIASEWLNGARFRLVKSLSRNTPSS